MIDKKMPLKVIKKVEHVNLNCIIKFCQNNYRGKCESGSFIEELKANTIMCQDFKFCTHHNMDHIFSYLQDLEDFINDIQDSVQVIEFDKRALRIVFKKYEIKNKEFEAAICISKEDEQKYDYRPQKDGGILMIDKNQMDLFIRSN